MRKKHMNKHKPRKIKIRLLAIFMLLVLFMCLLTAVVVYTQANQQFEMLYSEINQGNLKAYSDALTLKLRPMVRDIREIVFANDFIDNLKAPRLAKHQRIQDSLENRALRNRLVEIFYQEMAVTAVLLFGDENRYVYVSDAYESDYDRYLHRNVEIEEDWYKHALEAQGKEVFYGQNVITGNQNQISFAKEIRDPNELYHVGMLVVVLDSSIVSDIALKWHVGQESHVMMIVDSKPEYGPDMIFASEDEYDRQFEDLKNVLLDPNDRSEYLVTTHQNELTGWLFVNSILKSELSSASRLLLNNIISLLIIVVIMGFVVSIASSSYISKPLEHLKEVIQNFDHTHQPIKAEFDDGEIGEIGNVLKEAVNKNIELNKSMTQLQIREREAEYQALQAQVNPHFLYNTLDSLYFMAVLHNVDDIAQMTEALSDMFKITLNKGNSILPLKSELDYIHKYMLIQAFRFPNRFHLEIDCPVALENYPLPKFLIQPFVENSIQHGFEPRVGQGCIRITCTEKDEKLIIVIEDDGVGVEDREQLSSGYGINNVKERIHLLYGESYGVSVWSQKGKGVRVTIQLPRYSEVLDEF